MEQGYFTGLISSSSNFQFSKPKDVYSDMFQVLLLQMVEHYLQKNAIADASSNNLTVRASTCERNAAGNEENWQRLR